MFEKKKESLEIFQMLFIYLFDMQVNSTANNINKYITTKHWTC